MINFVVPPENGMPCDINLVLSKKNETGTFRRFKSKSAAFLSTSLLKHSKVDKDKKITEE